MFELQYVRVTEILIKEVICQDIFKEPKNFVRISKVLNYTSSNETELVVHHVSLNRAPSSIFGTFRRKVRVSVAKNLTITFSHSADEVLLYLIIRAIEYDFLVTNRDMIDLCIFESRCRVSI